MEDSNIEKLLKENLELSKENNKMLKHLRSAQRRASFFRMFYWLVIIGISVGAYYYIQPYVDSLIKIYTGTASSFKEVQEIGKNLPDSKYINEFLNQIKEGKFPEKN